MVFPDDPRAVWARHALSRQALVKLVAGFTRHGVDVLAVKGVVTSSWLYEDSSERPLHDVDVRIRPRDFGLAVGAATREGWQVDRRLWTYRNLVLRIDGVSVDVEASLGSPFVSALGVDQLFARATRTQEGFWVPELHDHALLLTVNVFKDKLICAAPWAVEDVRRVVRRRGFDPQVLVARAREAALTAAVWVVADWMAGSAGDPAWREVRALLGGDSPARYRYTRALGRLVARREPTALALRVLTRMASDDPARWLPAVAVAAAWELESRVALTWGARRR